MHSKYNKVTFGNKKKKKKCTIPRGTTWERGYLGNDSYCLLKHPPHPTPTPRSEVVHREKGGDLRTAYCVLKHYILRYKNAHVLHLCKS